jgi:UDP-N-acetylmuramate dehydrogenase
MATHALPIDLLLVQFGDSMQENVLLAPYSSARIGGPADVLLTVKSAEELSDALRYIWAQAMPYYILGAGSNVLISDRGVRGIVILNRAKAVRFEKGSRPKVWVESGVVISNLANRCTSKGLSGLEWAAAVPGTIGGAVYGNAGAFGGDMAGNLIKAEVITESGRDEWPLEKLGYGYRTSVLKRGEVRAVVLSAELRLNMATKEEVSAKTEQFNVSRKASQPPGASMGSIFKNPTPDFAGRLIEAAGLKGTRIGNAEISPLHGNFFINHGKTKASDMRALIDLTCRTVEEKLGVRLELEIELVGEW